MADIYTGTSVTYKIFSGFFSQGAFIRKCSWRIQGVFPVTSKPSNNQKSCTCDLFKKKPPLPEESKFLEISNHRGAWWASISGVAQSRKLLKQLSSSSSSNHRGNPEINSADRVISLLCQFPHLPGDILQVPSITTLYACIREDTSSVFVLGH